MKTLPLGRIFSSVVIYFGLMSAASASISTITPSGKGTITAVRQASTAFQRDLEQLKSEAKDDAAKYCAAEGKQLKVLSVKTAKPFFGHGYATATVIFKSLDANDPELTAPVVSRTEVERGDAVSTAATDGMYGELLKLDDLRTKGILTEKEFKREKQKILNRAN